MTKKLVVIINILKVPKIEKILLYEMKFLVPNYSCLQNPWLGCYHPQIPVLSVFYPQLNLLNPSLNKIPGYATAYCCMCVTLFGSEAISSTSYSQLQYISWNACLQKYVLDMRHCCKTVNWEGCEYRRTDTGLQVQFRYLLCHHS